MIHIDDVPLLFTYPVVTQGVQSGYLDETHVLVYVPSSNSFTLVGEDSAGQMQMLAAIIRDYVPKAWSNINFAFFVSQLDKCQGLDGTAFLSQCQANGWSIAEGFDELILFLRVRCKANCKHLLVRGNGDCMVCDVLVSPFHTPVVQASFHWGIPYPDNEVTPRTNTAPTLSLKDQRKLDGVCPECGDRGNWVRTALICKVHGPFAGF